MIRRLPLPLLAGVLSALSIMMARATEETEVETDKLLSELAARAPHNARPDVLLAAYRDLTALVESGKLETAEQYYRAAVLFQNDLGDIVPNRLRYELALTAAAKGSDNAERMLPFNWDSFLNRLGRPVRIDRDNFFAKNPAFYDVDPAPECIRQVLLDPVKARDTAKGYADNVEIKALVETDQADRQVNWGTLSDQERQAIQQRDRERNNRMREILQTDLLRTAADFTAASLVMQHSPKPAGIQLAHELALCAMLLGERGQGRWLVAASYDRLLNQLGHPQRFGTQFAAGGLRRVDEAGICDDERVTFGCRPLADSKALQPKF